MPLATNSLAARTDGESLIPFAKLQAIAVAKAQPVRKVFNSPVEGVELTNSVVVFVPTPLASAIKPSASVGATPVAPADASHVPPGPGTVATILITA